MEKVSFLFDIKHNEWEHTFLESLDLSFSKKIFWWMVDLDNSIFDLCEPDYLLDCVANGSYIVVDHSQDPTSTQSVSNLYLSELFFEFDRRGLDKKQIIVLSPTPSSIFLRNKNVSYNYLTFNSLFEITKTFIKHTDPTSFEPFLLNPKKHFICLMRRDSSSRRLINYFLHSLELHNKGFISHLRYVEGKPFSHAALKEELIRYINFKEFDSEKFINFALKKHYVEDHTEFIGKGFAAHSYTLHKDLSRQSTFEIVSETDSNDTFMFSEKTFKPILNKSPFIFLGSPYALKYFRSLGFKTFNSVIDESYDTERLMYKRIKSALEQAKILCELNISECAKKLEQLNDVCEYNYNHFLNTCWDFNISSKIENLICKK